MSVLWKFMVEWYTQIINSAWLIPVLAPIIDMLDNLWRAFIGGGNGRKERQDD